MELTKKQIEQQDLVDNAIFNLFMELGLVKDVNDWDIAQISEVRETLIEVFNLDEMEFYPYSGEMGEEV